MKLDLSALDGVRARAAASLGRVPGALGARLRAVNDALGRPAVSAEELADRRDFAARLASAVAPAPVRTGRTGRTGKEGEPAPVVIFHMDKQRRDVERVTEILDASEIPYTVRNLEGDPAGQAATRRDSKGFRLPVVFIAGEAVGGRAELLTLGPAGLAAKVWGR